MRSPGTVYLDHNATAVPLPAAVQAAAAWLARPGNPSSVHGPGRAARAAIERARGQVAASLGADRREVTFTSGATEALHLAVLGVTQPGDHAVISSVEHPAVLGACAKAALEVAALPVTADGGLTPDEVAAAIRPDTRLFAVMRAQNEIGTLYDVAALAEAARAIAPNVVVLCDAVQAWGKVPLSVGSLGADLVAVSGHKIGGPCGAGALWARPGLPLRSGLAGGPQERGRRAGTENVPGLVGLGVAAAAVPQRLAAMPRVQALRDRLRAGLAARLGQAYVEHGGPDTGLPNTLSFRVEGVGGDVLLAALDLEGVALSSGSACSSGAVEPSPVLLALGLGDARARQGLRASLGPETTADDVDHLLAALPALVERARAA